MFLSVKMKQRNKSPEKKILVNDVTTLFSKMWSK
jgi:phenylpyruvate tautomerase PptA (4-oxalocrotonate tautomerase family)